MSLIKKIFFLLALPIFLGSCATANIFQPIPLTLSPLVLINPIGLATNAAGTRLYLANSNNTVLYFDSSFVIMDTTNPTNPTPIAVISIPNFSGNVILDEPRGFVYIPNRESADKADIIDQILRININESSPQFLTVDFIDSASNPFGGAYDGVSSFYSACTGQVVRYDVNSFTGFTSVDTNVTTAQGRVLKGDDTRELGLTPSGNFLFVTNRSDSMLILDVGQFPAPIAPGQTDIGTEAIDYILDSTDSTRGITKDANFIYVVDGTPPSIKILTEANLVAVNGAPQEIPSSSLQVAAIPVGNNPSEVVLDTANHMAYVSNTDDNNVSFIDTNLQVEVARIQMDVNLPPNVPIGQGPFAMALINSGGTNYLYVANFNTSNVTIVNADTRQVVTAFPQ